MYSSSFKEMFILFSQTRYVFMIFGVGYVKIIFQIQIGVCTEDCFLLLSQCRYISLDFQEDCVNIIFGT